MPCAQSWSLALNDQYRSNIAVNDGEMDFFLLQIGLKPRRMQPPERGPNFKNGRNELLLVNLVHQVGYLFQIIDIGQLLW